MATSIASDINENQPGLSKPTVSFSPKLEPATSASSGIGSTTDAYHKDLLWNWVDGVMKREGRGWTRSQDLADPSEEFADGTRLIRLIETLSGRKSLTPYHVDPAGLDEFNSIDNLRMAFRMLKNEGIEPGIKPSYLFHPGAQRQHLLEDLLWRTMLHFRLYRHVPNLPSRASNEERQLLMKRHLLDWARDKTARHADTYRLKMEDLGHGFDDGFPYLLLLHEYDPSLVSVEDLQHYSLPTQRANAMATTSSLAKRHLGIPKIMGPRYGISGFSNERANLAYLSEFWWRFHLRDQELRSPSTILDRARRFEQGEPQYAERGLSEAEEERLRAEQSRLRAETERNRANEERLRALEARRRAEQDKLLAEQEVQRAIANRERAELEARRALERRELALREKDRLDEEKRKAEDERRYALDSVRRNEVERLRIEQERKRLEDEVRRAEDERLRTFTLSKKAEEDKRRRDDDLRFVGDERARVDEIRRFTLLRMDEAERERARAAEERRLAREEMKLAEQERRVAEDERRRAELEKQLAERERLRAEYENQLLLEEEDKRRRSGYYLPTVQESRILAAPAILPVTTPAPLVTTRELDTEERLRKKAEKRARRAEEQSKKAEKLRKKEERRRLQVEADKKKLEDYITATRSVLVGVLDLNVVEGRGFGRGVKGPFAKIELEGQQVQTHSIKKTLIPQWRSEFKLYHSDPDANLEVRVFDKGGRFGGQRFIGRVEVPMKDLEDGVEQDLWYPLHYKQAEEEKIRRKEKKRREKERYKGWVPEEVRAWAGEEELGEIHLKMTYRKDPTYTKPGVSTK